MSCLLSQQLLTILLYRLSSPSQPQSMHNADIELTNWLRHGAMPVHSNVLRHFANKVTAHSDQYSLYPHAKQFNDTLNNMQQAYPLCPNIYKLCRKSFTRKEGFI